MNLHEPSEKLTFPQWYYSLPVMNIKAIKNQIIDDCHLERDEPGKEFCRVFYNRLKGITPVPPLARPVIEKIAGCPLNFEFTTVTANT